MTGKDKFKETADKLRTDTLEKENAARSSALAQLAYTKEIALQNPELAKMMAEDAKEEALKNVGSIPYLKVYVANKSTTTLADGTDPNNGWFVYAPTGEQYENPMCHILHISRGFRLPSLPDEEGVVKNRWTHIVSGLMMNDEPKAFWIFISGQARVNELWEFQKTLKTMTNNGIPTFSMTVRMGTKKVKTDKSPAIVPTYTIEKDESGEYPLVVSDVEMYRMLKDNAEKQEALVNKYIEEHNVAKQSVTEVKEEIDPLDPGDDAIPF